MRAIALILISIGLPACAGTAFPSHERTSDEVRRLALSGLVAETPVSAKLVARAVITIGGSENVVTLYSVLTPPDGLEVVALSDLGGTLFGVGLRGSETEIRQGSSVFDDDLLESMVRDLAAALLAPAREGSELVELEGGVSALRYSIGSSVVVRSAAPGDEVIVLRGRSDQIAARVTIASHVRDGAGLLVHPKRFTIEGADYRADVDVVTFSLLAGDDS